MIFFILKRQDLSTQILLETENSSSSEICRIFTFFNKFFSPPPLFFLLLITGLIALIAIWRLARGRVLGGCRVRGETGNLGGKNVFF